MEQRWLVEMARVATETLRPSGCQPRSCRLQQHLGRQTRESPLATGSVSADVQVHEGAWPNGEGRVLLENGRGLVRGAGSEHKRFHPAAASPKTRGDVQEGSIVGPPTPPIIALPDPEGRQEPVYLLTGNGKSVVQDSKRAESQPAAEGQEAEPSGERSRYRSSVSTERE